MVPNFGNELDQRLALRRGMDTTFQRRPLSRCRDPDRRIGKATVGRDRRSYVFIDLRITLVRAARLAGTFHRTARTPLDARVRFDPHLFRRQKSRLQRPGAAYPPSPARTGRAGSTRRWPQSVPAIPRASQRSNTAEALITRPGSGSGHIQCAVGTASAINRSAFNSCQNCAGIA